MNYISQIFERLDLQQIRGFLLNGDVWVKPDKGNYLERLERAEQPILDLIKEKLSDAEYREIEDEFNYYTSVTQSVFMEIGLQCGATLLVQLLTGQEKG